MCEFICSIVSFPYFFQSCQNAANAGHIQRLQPIESPLHFLIRSICCSFVLIPRDGQRYIAEQKPCSSNLILHKCMIPNDQLYFMKLKATITKQVPSTVDQ